MAGHRNGLSNMAEEISRIEILLQQNLQKIHCSIIKHFYKEAV